MRALEVLGDGDGDAFSYVRRSVSGMKGFFCYIPIPILIPIPKPFLLSLISYLSIIVLILDIVFGSDLVAFSFVVLFILLFIDLYVVCRIGTSAWLSAILVVSIHWIFLIFWGAILG